MGPKQNSNSKAVDEEYLKKRERNNVAVKRSREKSRQKQKETLQRVNRLREENEELEMKVKLLSKELSVLRDLFLEHAGVSSTLAGNSFNTQEIKEEGVEDEEEDEEGIETCQVEEDSAQVCPVNTLAAKMDHEYSYKSFTGT